MKCPFCGGEYRPIKPPVDHKVAFYVPNCAPGENGEIVPDGGIICDAFVCSGCGNIQMAAKRRPMPAQKAETEAEPAAKPAKKTSARRSTKKTEEKVINLKKQKKEDKEDK